MERYLIDLQEIEVAVGAIFTRHLADSVVCTQAVQRETWSGAGRRRRKTMPGK